MLGRFLGYDGTEENKPAARFGHLAMAPTVPVKHPWGFTQPSFLIECRSVSGYSGSPIFIYRVQSTIGAGLVAIGADRGKEYLAFLASTGLTSIASVATTMRSTGPSLTLTRRSGVVPE
jgi:hypothetical protein